MSITGSLQNKTTSVAALVLKVMRMIILLGFRQQLSRQMEKQARPLPVVRPTPRV